MIRLFGRLFRPAESVVLGHPDHGWSGARAGERLPEPEPGSGVDGSSAPCSFTCVAPAASGHGPPAVTLRIAVVHDILGPEDAPVRSVARPRAPVPDKPDAGSGSYRGLRVEHESCRREGPREQAERVHPPCGLRTDGCWPRTGTGWPSCGARALPEFDPRGRLVRAGRSGGLAHASFVAAVPLEERQAVALLDRILEELDSEPIGDLRGHLFSSPGLGSSGLRFFPSDRQ